MFDFWISYLFKLDGAYRDTTIWLDANHSFQFYVDKGKLAEDVCFPCFNYKNLRLFYSSFE